MNPLQELERGRPWGANWPGPTVIVVPIICALFVAPLLTMLCRSPLAGMIFAVVVPGLIGLAGELLAIARYGLDPSNKPGDGACAAAVDGPCGAVEALDLSGGYLGVARSWVRSCSSASRRLTDAIRS